MDNFGRKIFYDHIEVFNPITFSSPMLLVRLVRSHGRSAERYGRSRRPDVPNKIIGQHNVPALVEPSGQSSRYDPVQRNPEE